MNARIVIIEQTDSPTVERALEGMIENGTANGYWTLLDMDGRGEDTDGLAAVRERLNVPGVHSTPSQRRCWQSSDERAVIVDLLTNVVHLVGREAFNDAVETARIHHAVESRCAD